MRASVLLALVLGAAPLLAQDLGQAAAREREKREKKATAGKPAPARVYTNEDLPQAEGAAPTPAGEARSTGLSRGAAAEMGIELPPAAPQGEGSPSGTEVAPRTGAEAEQDDTSEERSWRLQAADARKPLRDAEQKLADVDGRMSSIRQQMSPFNPNRENDTNKILGLQEELRSLETERESARQGLEGAKRSWEEFADNARRSGVPVRWLEDAPR